MVLLHVKRGDENLFLLQASVADPVDEVLQRAVTLYNGCLKVHRICSGMEQLADHGYTLPPEMHGLTEDQIVDLKLTDDHAHTCIPSGGHTENRDPCGRRCGKQPGEKMRELLHKTTQEAKAMISKELVGSGTPFTEHHLYDALEILRGAVTIVYPMGLPLYDPVRQELENREDLAGSQDLKMVLDAGTTQLWFAGKELQCGKKLSDYLGRNEKTKVVVKVQQRGKGAPGREPAMTEDQRRALMASEFRRREELKKLKECDDDSFLDTAWADSHQLHRSFQGLCNISWKPH